MGGSWRVPVMEGLLSKTFVQELKLDGTYNDSSFAREYESEWSGDAENAFFSAELKIKGDPYWLFRALPGKEFADSASYTRYNTAALVFNYPTDNYNEINKSDTAITGIYLVTEVVSTFSGGNFEQKLSLKRILNGTSVNRLANSGEDV